MRLRILLATLIVAASASVGSAQDTKFPQAKVLGAQVQPGQGHAELIVMTFNADAVARNLSVDCDLWADKTGLGSETLQVLNVPPASQAMKSQPVTRSATRATCRIVDVK